MKNGSNGVGNPKYNCKSSGFGGVFKSRRKTDEEKELILRAVQERNSLRAVGRIFRVSHQSVLNWTKKAESLEAIALTLLPYKQRNLLELDELWSFVHQKSNKQ